MQPPGRLLKTVLAASALSLLTAVPWARAAVLRSGVMFNAGTDIIVICFASNLGPKPVTVTALRGFRQDGMSVDIASVGPTGCLFAPIQPGASCEFETDAALVRMEVEIKGSAKNVRARCTLFSDGFPRDSAELR
jgi:hypothetical protein